MATGATHANDLVRTACPAAVRAQAHARESDHNHVGDTAPAAPNERTKTGKGAVKKNAGAVTKRRKRTKIGTERRKGTGTENVTGPGVVARRADVGVPSPVKRFVA